MNANLAAFLEVIAACEGVSGPDGWRTLFGGSLFESFDDHPRTKITANGYTSTAAGRYQILERTWDDFIKAAGPHKFDPEGQTACALWLINRRGATADAMAGHLEAAIEKCNKEWASLPGSPYGQPTRSLAYCRTVFAAALPDALSRVSETREGIEALPNVKADNTPNPDLSATQPEPTMAPLMLAPLLGSLIQTLIGAFTPVAQAKLGQVLGKAGADPTASATIINSVVQAVAQAAGTTPEVLQASPQASIAAVSAVQADAVKMAAVEAQAMQSVEALLPLVNRLHELSKESFAMEEASKDAASKRAVVDNTPDQDRVLTWGILGMMVLILVALGIGIALLIAYERPYEALLTLFAGVVGTVIGKFGTRVDYRYGSSNSSKEKDEALRNVVMKRGQP